MFAATKIIMNNNAPCCAIEMYARHVYIFVCARAHSLCERMSVSAVEHCICESVCRF